jgi:hypothetical protein
LREDHERHREAGTFDGWFHSLSADTKDTEYSHTGYECKYYSTAPGAFFVQQRHLDTSIANAILKKGTRNSFHLWPKQDYDLSVTRLQMPHAMGGFGLTPSVLAQSTAKVAMAFRFVGLVGFST